MLISIYYEFQRLYNGFSPQSPIVRRRAVDVIVSGMGVLQQPFSQHLIHRVEISETYKVIPLR